MPVALQTPSIVFGNLTFKSKHSAFLDSHSSTLGLPVKPAVLIITS